MPRVRAAHGQQHAGHHQQVAQHSRAARTRPVAIRIVVRRRRRIVSRLVRAKLQAHHSPAVDLRVIQRAVRSRDQVDWSAIQLRDKRMRRGLISIQANVVQALAHEIKVKQAVVVRSRESAGRVVGAAGDGRTLLMVGQQRIGKSCIFFFRTKSFRLRPTEVLPGSHQVEFLAPPVAAGAHVAGEQPAVGREAEAEWIAKPKGVHRARRPGRRAKWVVRRNFAAGLYPADFSGKRVHLLGQFRLPGVADREIQPSVRSEPQAAAVVARAVGRQVGANDGGIDADPVLVAQADDLLFLVGNRRKDVDEPCAKKIWIDREPKQAAFAERIDLDLREGFGLQHAVCDDADGALALSDEKSSVRGECECGRLREPLRVAVCDDFTQRESVGDLLICKGRGCHQPGQHGDVRVARHDFFQMAEVCRVRCGRRYPALVTHFTRRAKSRRYRQKSRRRS